MNPGNRNFIVRAVVLALLASLACQTLSVPPTATPEPTETPLPQSTNTATATQTPSSTPEPTNTTAPTPASVGQPVSNSEYEVDVVKVRKLESVYLSKVLVWKPKPGYLFLELGVQVTNLKTGSRASVHWKDIYVIDNLKIQRPGWGGYKVVAQGIEVNPPSIVFEQLKNINDSISFDEVVFLRLIWTVTDSNPTTVYFVFDNSPLIEVVID